MPCAASIPTSKPARAEAQPHHLSALTPRLSLLGPTESAYWLEPGFPLTFVFALRRIATLPLCSRDVTAANATSHEIGCAPEYSYETAYRAYWVARSRCGVHVSDSPLRCSCRPRLPDTFASGSSSRALSLPSRVSEIPPARPYRPDTFPGLSSLIAVTACGVHTREHPKPASFRPRRFSRPRRLTPPLAFAGLFHPATTSRVRSSGSSPDEKPYGLVARRCPHAVARRPCSQFYPSAPGRRARLQGLAPLASPLQRTTV
jgi:hypothetical protein